MLFEDQTDSILNWAGQQARPRSFQRGEVLSFSDGPTYLIYLVVEGQVKLRSVGESGKEKIIDVAGPGDTFGPLIRIVEGNRSHSPPTEGIATEAVALSRGEAVCYDLEHFQDLVDRRPPVVRNLSRVLGFKQQRLEFRLNRLLYRSSLGKVAGLLAELAERYGIHQPDGSILLQFKLTHQEMASLIGSKRETVSECLAILELDEVVSTQRGRMKILQPNKLDQIV